jgi:hypothetical protein
LSAEIGHDAVRIAPARQGGFALRPEIGQARPVGIAFEKVQVVAEFRAAATKPCPFDDVARHAVVQFRRGLGGKLSIAFG